MKSIDMSGYVPILKWRQGEYQALYRLKVRVKDRIVPLIEVCPVEWDFELRREAKTLDQHLEPFGKRLFAKWGNRFAFLDAGMLDPGLRMRNGAHPLLHLGNDARAKGGRPIPVVHIDSDASYVAAASELAFTDRWGVCLRAKLDDIADPDFDEVAEGLLARLGVPLDEVDVVLDLGAPNFEPLADFVDLVESYVGVTSVLERSRSFVVAGTSFPDSLAGLTSGAQLVLRQEWRLYRALINALPRNRRKPTFGDYAIAHPILAQGDMRVMKPSANIRYTVDDAWCLVKGKNVRDYGFDQYQDQCRELIRTGYFAGKDYSAGDEFIEDCALRNGSTGNLSTWRWVGTNHHITRVVDDLATLHGS